MSDKYVIYYLQTRACVVEWPGQCHFLLCRWQSLKQSVWTDDRVTGVDRDISTSVPLELFAKTLETGNILQQVTTNYLKWSHAGLMLETVNITQGFCCVSQLWWHGYFGHSRWNQFGASCSGKHDALPQHARPSRWRPWSSQLFPPRRAHGTHTNFADCRWFFADQACQRDLLSWQSRRADPQNAAQSADRTPCCPGGIDDHWYSDSFEEVEAVSGCPPARNHNSHAHVHACCSFVRGSLGSAAHSQNRKLQERTNHGLVQAWSRHWNVLGEHCSQHGGTGKSRCARPGCAVILFASCWPKAFQKK